MTCKIIIISYSNFKIKLILSLMGTINCLPPVFFVVFDERVIFKNVFSLLPFFFPSHLCLWFLPMLFCDHCRWRVFMGRWISMHACMQPWKLDWVRKAKTWRNSVFGGEKLHGSKIASVRCLHAVWNSNSENACHSPLISAQPLITISSFSFLLVWLIRVCAQTHIFSVFSTLSYNYHHKNFNSFFL